ncbi:MAG: response regulator transcription factor [Roseiarcus sp.]|uniref:LuxR C-terminal-related transcriptional regulator n=1 Tax=Roseiarcus sp. TaxID=1969460 RepID=UPI003BAF93E4
MSDNTPLIQVDGNQARTPFLETVARSREIESGGPAEIGSPTADEFIAVIESRTFIGECIRRSMLPAFPLQIETFSDAVELQRKCRKQPRLILLSEIEDTNDEGANVFKSLSQIAPGTPVVVLATTSGPERAKAAISHGAQGYIPITLGLDITIEAVRFVLAGGTYVPIDYLLTSSWQGERGSGTPQPSGAVTPRELAVVRAIQRGKSNKVIAYELGMCESTVKVHVRRVMKKLNAKNRTEVAIKSQTALSGLPD